MIRQKTFPLFSNARVCGITSTTILCLVLWGFAMPAQATVPAQDGVWEQISKALAPPSSLAPQARIAPAATNDIVNKSLSENKPLPIDARKQISNAVAFIPERIKGVSSSVAKVANKNEKMIWPTEGLIYSAFNASRGSRRHGAIDICTSKGTPILAAQDGTVSVVANGGKLFRGYGKIVILDHGKGVWTLYSHCDTTLVKLGQRVKQGDYIATVGNTGRTTTHHLHFEVRVAGVKKDPLKYLPNRPEMVKATNYRARSNKKAN